MMDRPSLSGIRVLDLGWIWAGPLVGAAFAEMGADVVKVESAKRFDPYRLRGVERMRELGENRREASPSFHKLNHSKRSITLDLRSPAGRELLLRLAGEADLLLENFSAGTLERLGIGWPVLKEANPRLVVVSMSAGGQQGQWRDLRAYALITSAMAGYESLISYDGEEAIGGPTFGVADPTVSAFGLLGGLSALYHARKTGEGRHIDLSGIESLMSVMPEAFLGVSRNGTGEGSVPAVEFTVGDPQSDEWHVLVLTSADQWAALGGSDPWSELLASSEARRRAGEWLAHQPARDVLAAAADAGIPIAPVLTVEARNARPPIADLMGTLEHPITGEEPTHPSPWGSWEEPRPAPLLGQHTDEVLREWLALDDDAIAALRDRGALS
jgi:crotonobetainyl-CoA:carnitine CoA-transferase CaiB-like acyl-CoA transferase